MGSHPINLAIRFLLELAALYSLGLWGWRLTNNNFRFLWAVCLPLGMAILWGTFAVPDDPSRSGAAPIPTPGYLRLLLEILIFSISAWALNDLGYLKSMWMLIVVVSLHYLASFDRILWLLKL